jgi:NADH-quinone oxidoreductase subunit J
MDLPIPSFPQLVFLVLSAIAIIGALLMITRNDAVHSALSLVIVLFQLAGMYVLLDAPFLAVLQVLVYAGAILVLFLFVIMLLQIREGPELNHEHRYQPFAAWILGGLIAISLVLIIVAAGNLTAPAAATTLTNGQAAANPGMGWTAAGIDAFGGEPRALGRELYTNFLLPFEVASLILLVAVVGAIVLARRDDVVERKVGVGISLGRQYVPGSPQMNEAVQQLSDIVPDLKMADTGPNLEAVDPAVPVVSGRQPTVDERTPPSMAAHAGEDERLSGTRR